MPTIIFDDSGGAWDARSPDLRRRLHCLSPDFDFLKYLTENLGFVALTQTRRGAAVIRFRPAVVSPVGLAAALFALADMAPERVVVSHPGDGCVDELVRGLARTFARIEEVVGSAREAETPAFLKQERSLPSLDKMDGALSALFSLWAEAGQVYDPATCQDVLSGALRGRFMFVEASTGSQLTIADVGPGFVAYDEPWRRVARGLPVEHQPDYAYGSWVRGLFQQSLEQGRPHLDDIDAVIARPRRNDHVRVRYRRLILPCRRGPSGTPGLLSASLVDPAIDLRGVAARSGCAQRLVAGGIR